MYLIVKILKAKVGGPEPIYYETLTGLVVPHTMYIVLILKGAATGAPMGRGDGDIPLILKSTGTSYVLPPPHLYTSFILIGCPPIYTPSF